MSRSINSPRTMSHTIRTPSSRARLACPMSGRFSCDSPASRLVGGRGAMLRRWTMRWGTNLRRELRSNNSWMHNLPALMKGDDQCTLLLHPDDAARLGLVEGGEARVTSAAGSVVAPVHVTESVMQGVVSLPHGWGHSLDGARL